ncbi:MAG: phosphoribosyltransferase family protein [Acidiferrobacterales bacterium]|nr:phosphoribosyltransferase family protein [Acidiferrobacterales bacterium]
MKGNYQPENKIYITASALFEDSCKLAASVLKSGYRPNYLVALWRGGTPVGITIQELLAYYGVKTDHIAIRTSLYETIGHRRERIRIHGLGYLIDRITDEDSVLIVDDIFDTGLTIEALIATIRKKARKNTPKDIRVAATWFKPGKNKTDRIPDYFVNASDDWIVFPHELLGLQFSEIEENKPYIANVMNDLEHSTQFVPGGTLA